MAGRYDAKTASERRASASGHDDWHGAVMAERYEGDKQTWSRRRHDAATP